MRILHMISGGDVGGAKTHVHTLLDGLSKTEDVLLVCFMDGPFAAEARELGIPTRVLTSSIHCVVKQLTELVRSERFDILHCHGARANLVGCMLRKRTGLPTVTTVHSDPKRDYMGRPLAGLTYGTINKSALRKMDFWIGVSQPTVDMLHERGFDPNRTFVISNGVVFDHDPPKQSREEFLRQYGISLTPETTVFGIAARISPVKDMGTLIRGFAKTLAVCPAARLLIAGDGEQRKQMEELAAELCPPGAVVFAGWLSDTHSFYSAIDVNMLTSLSEGFPYVLPEGASWHCATIATRVGGIPSLVRHGYNGLLFAPQDVDTLAEHMIRLAKDHALLRCYADRIYADAKEKYSVDVTVNRQREIYETILRRSSRSAARNRDGILICGAYGKGNSGDDSILQAIVQELRQRDPDIPLYATSRSPSKTARESQVGTIYTFRSRKIRQRMKQTAVYLSGGGSLIQDATSSRSLWYYLSSIRMAKRLGNRVMMFSCGIGPVSHALNRSLAAKTIRRYVDCITLRDNVSAGALEELGVKDIPLRVTADMAFLVAPAPQESVEQWCAAGCVSGTIKPSDRLLILTPRPWNGSDLCLAGFAAAAVHAAREYGLTPVLLAMEPGMDLSVCQKIAALALAQDGINCPILTAPQGASLVVGLIRWADAVVGMRLHSLIFAAAQGTPFVGVSYDPKVAGFVDYLGLGGCCLLEQASPDRLCSMLDDILQTTGEEYLAAAERLRSMASKNCEEVMALLNGNP